MMRPARSRRVLAQRKFAQGAYVPPSAAPAPPTNGDRRDNNPSARNFIIQHQVGPSVFVDYISYQALELHHKGLQPFVMVKRLEVPPSQRTRARRTELMRNRELVRNRELDRNRDIHDKKTRENLQTTATRESTRNKESNRSKNIATNKDKNNDNTTAKDSSKKNNLRQTSVKALKEIVKSKETPNEKEIIKKKDLAKNKLSKTKEKSSLSTNKSNREKPLPIKKPKSTKPMHVMSLRSKRQSKQDFNKKAVATRATKRLAVARRKVANALKDTTSHEKPKQKSTDALKTPKRGTPAPSEFSVDDNRPLTYFAKCSTPKRVPAAPVPRVALVPLTSAAPSTAATAATATTICTTSTTTTAAPEPVAGPSGSNKKKITKTRSPKTNTNPYVLLPNIAPTAPAPAQTSTETQTKPPEPPFYSTPPNIYQWMNKSFDDEQGLLKVLKSKPAPWAAVQPSCPALRWHTVKELNNADKAQLEARCLKCGACMRIDKLMKISETLKSLVKFDVSGDDDASTAEPNKQEDKVSSDGTIYMELLPKMANKLMKIRTHNVLGKNMLSACLIPRAHAQQTKDLSLVEQEGLLEQINATLTASTQAAERSGRPVIGSSSDTDSSTGEPDPKVRPTFKMKRQRRQSVCADLAMQPQTQRKRRQSVSAELASQQQEEQQKSDVAMQPRPQRQRRKSMCAELAMKEMKEQQQRELAIKEQQEKHKRELAIKEKEEQQRKEMTKRLQEQRQRELAIKERQEQQRREYAQRQQEEHQRRESEKQQEQQRREAEMRRQQEQQRYMFQMAGAQRPLQNRDIAYLTMALQAGPNQRVRETEAGEFVVENLGTTSNKKPEENVQPQPQQQKRDNVPQQQEQRQPKSVPEVKVQPQPQRQRRQSVSAELAAKQQQQEQRQRQPKSIPAVKVQPQPQRQRRQSVSAELAAKQQQEQRQRELASSTTATRSPRQRLGRQTVSAESAAMEQSQQQTHESVSKEKAQAQPQQRKSGSGELPMPQRRQRRQSVCAKLAAEDLVAEDSDDEPIIQRDIQADLASMDSDRLCAVIDEVTADFDPTQIQLSTPISSILEVDRRTELENIEEPLRKQTGEPTETYEFPLVNEETPLLHDIKRIFQSVGKPSQQERVAGTSGRDSPGLIGSESSSLHLTYEDSVNGDAASEARMMAEVDEQARALEKEKDAKGDNCPDKGHSSGTDPSASSGFPNSADTAQIVDAPVFHPSLEEFDDPIAYFEKILPIAAKYGICKVVPPDGWEPKCKINEEIRFDVTNQYISRLYCRWGPASRELSALKLCLQLQNVNVTRPPLVDGVEVNLPKLYHLVQRHGGLENVINKKRWGKVAEEMRLNKAPVIERKLDQLYVKYLLPYATLDHQERQEIMKKVEMAWHHKNQKLLDRATNPLHRQKRMLGESESSDGETEDEGTANALADAEDCVVPGLCMNFAKFKKVATNAYENHIGIERPGADMPSIEIIEDRYWRLVVMGTEHLCVNTAAIDTGEEGHGFTKNKNDYYGRHPWNLKMFSQNRGNILRYLGPVLGMTVPTLHLGMIFSTSCWHKDPHALPWTEFLHNGPGRIWYGIPDDQSDNFRKAVETLTPTSCQNKCLWLPTDIAMIPPSILREHNVSLSRTVQDPNEFVLVFPKAYSCSISTGYTESESVYFAPRSWLENLEQVIQETRESCEPTMFSLEQLLILMCQDPDADVDLLKQVKPVLDKIVSEEISYRQQLEEKGLKFVTETETASKSSRKRNASAYNVRDQDECEYCRATLYLSKVRGMTGKKSSLCLEHALLLLNNPKYKEVNVGQLEVFVYMTVEELNDVTASVEARVGPSS